ncbi:hypothetical protein LPJ73_000273 [Coemansia sp. RSA 2703]|nr:hypothetical protein LPJ73_000273 [Coemansia sp. RSA 2703]KAJ2366206.1 hypothetical protein IW150_006005 [Coemansia sp. RSA 2607]KAJ2395725.1 hypothetical protein GGI05_001450 [Coemansia sp. RSA 2603]
MSPLPKRAVIAITSYHGPFYANGDPTGLFYTEALHPYTVLVEAGFTVDLASETGTYGMDPHSLQEPFANEADLKVYNNPEAEFTKKLENIKKASDLNPADYGLFFASAGHATLFDYPNAKSLISIAEDVWARGGVIGSVCHGPAIFPYVMDKNTGKSVVFGKKVTGFTDEGEVELGLMDRIHEFNLVPISKAAEGAGAIYVKPEGPFDDYSIVDGRLVTGTNPASAHSAAVKAVAVFESL